MRKTELTKLKLKAVSGWEAKFKGRNITDIAKSAGVSRGTIYNVLKGESLPSVANINRIEEALDKNKILT